MPLKYAENVVSAKVKAIYGRRLTPADYMQLFSQKSVGDAAAYLRDHTCYREVLSEAKGPEMRRGQLEHLLRKYPAHIYGRLARYHFSDSFFPWFYKAQYEVSQILAAMRMLNTKEAQPYLPRAPKHFLRGFSFDMAALAAVNSFNDLLAVLEGSWHYGLVVAHRPKGQHISIPACEAALLTGLYQQAMEYVSETYSSREKKDLEEMLALKVDVHNFLLILRMKRFGSPKDEILPLLMNAGTRMSRIMREKLLEAEGAEGVLKKLGEVPALKKYFRPEQGQRPEAMAKARSKAICRHIFRFSSKPVVVLFCFMALLELEQYNIITIVEGIRYGMPGEKIQELIV